VNEDLIIYTDRLIGGKVEEVDCMVSPAFIGVVENDFQFVDPVHVKGAFYLADDHLVGHLVITTTLRQPCSVCNTISPFPLTIENYYIAEPLENIPSGLYYPHEGIREAILLEAPNFSECHGGNCPSRSALTPFIRQHDQPLKDDTEAAHSYLPFKNLE